MLWAIFSRRTGKVIKIKGKSALYETQTKAYVAGTRQFGGYNLVRRYEIKQTKIKIKNKQNEKQKNQKGLYDQKA